MTSPKMQAQMIRAQELLEGAGETGLTIHSLGEELELDTEDPQGPGRKRLFKVIRNLRLEYADTAGIPIRYDGGQCFYVWSQERSEGSRWQGARTSKRTSDLQVDVAHWQAMVECHDGRSVDGKIARIFLRYHTRMLEDIEEVFRNMQETSGLRVKKTFASGKVKKEAKKKEPQFV